MISVTHVIQRHRYDFCYSCYTEAQIRFLKAKLRVMQEELDRLAAECTRKVCMGICYFPHHLCFMYNFYTWSLLQQTKDTDCPAVRLVL